MLWLCETILKVHYQSGQNSVVLFSWNHHSLH